MVEDAEGRNTRRPTGSWGPPLWAFLHTVTLIDYDNDEIEAPFVRRCRSGLFALKDAIPCEKCALHYGGWLGRLDEDGDYRGRLGMFRWTVDLHNSVNVRIGKAECTYDEALSRWSVFSG
jgi:hypothetical protein